MTSDRIDELIALATRGELSETERRELDEAAAADPIVATDLDEALESAAALQRQHAEEPPAALRSSVLAAISSTPQAAPVEPDVSPVVSLQAERERRRFRPAILAAAAAVALFGAGGVILVATDEVSVDPSIVWPSGDAPDGDYWQRY